MKTISTRTLSLGSIAVAGSLAIAAFVTTLVTAENAGATGWGGGGYSSCSGCKVDVDQAQTTQAMLAVLAATPETKIPKSVQQSLENIRAQLTYQEIAAVYVRRQEMATK